MAATLQSTLEVEDALVRASDRLGMKVMLLRMVAAELPDNPWLLDLTCVAEGDVIVASTTHLCGSACRGEPRGCLTAFKVEDAVGKRVGRLVSITGVERVGEDGLRVRLRPMAA